MVDWVPCNIKPEFDGAVLIASNYGVRSGHFLKDWNGKFQDHLTQNDEGMSGLHQEPFVPHHWAVLPEPPKER